MDFVYGLVKVLVGAFVLFTVARIALTTIGTRSKWLWVGIVGLLALANMIIHRIIGSTINPPSFTAVFLALTLSGLSPKESKQLDPWIKRAIIAVATGSILGWTTYASVASI